MEKKRESGQLAVFVAGILFMICMGFLPFFYTRNSYITAQKNIIGILYEKEPEVCEELVPFLLEGDTFVKDSGKGTQALISMGYTSAGGDYLYEATGWQKCYLGVCLVQVVLAGGLICILLHFRRQRKQGEDAIREAKKYIEEGRAREAYLEDKNSRTQAFIENIAHQIKTPLSCISISLDLILEEANDGEKEQILPCFVYLNQIKTLMKRLLDIAGLEAGKILMHRERISLGSLLEECRAEFPDGAKRIFISMAGEQERTGEYYGDPEWLKEVFCNILKNALEHSGGDEPVEVTGWRTEEGIKIAIRDHGKGISEADLPHIFDRFYPVGEEKHSHTGIGLNLAKLIIEKHFGTIKADNYENGGAVFSIVLPDYGLKNEKIE